METLTLTVPLPVASTFRVARLLIDVENQSLQVVLREALNGVFVGNGRVLQAVYGGAEAMTLIGIINTSNHSVTSLNTQIMRKLVTDGLITTGTVAG